MHHSDLIPLAHIPVNLPRQTYLGEQLFLETWQDLAEQEVCRYDGRIFTQLQTMFNEHRWPAEQLEATVAASVLCWLGTNCGQSFLNEAKQLADTLSGLDAADAYLMRWATENARRNYINRGIRVLESLLTPAAQLQDCEGGYFLVARQVEAPSGRAYEAAEHVIRWLATEHGQQFLAKSNERVYQARVRRNLAQLEEAGLGSSVSAARYREELMMLQA